MTDTTNAEFLINVGKKQNRLIIFYVETGEKYGNVKFFAVPRNWHPLDLTNKFTAMKAEDPDLKAGLEGDHIRK